MRLDPTSRRSLLNAGTGSARVPDRDDRREAVVARPRPAHSYPGKRARARVPFRDRVMSSNPIRGIRRKKSSLTEVKIAVLGAPGVGKSALTVRFLTKRYIGEYDHQAETRYKHEVMVDGEPILFENDEEMPLTDVYNWADALVLVFAITDRRSFNYVRRVKQTMLDNFEMPVALVANKADMVHLRQVSTEEGEILAKDFECCFTEVAAAEQVGQVAEVFLEVCREVLSVRRKNKQSLLDRMLGGKTAAVKAYARGKSDSALPKE
ncbi:ras-related and estrogen-regulated growth inhibitor isoform X2 [Sipha flava]|uniref:small monomeric GTPase n=1 Tax=Sipha flava TaxID=143950 RepID=A0A8B8GG26_9HEMI|nr:ras-related and estrogen-regulated growth inhibitor isoform X2 [Sipha flava]